MKMKAQIISMDFITGAVMYIVVISFFFFSLKESYFSKSADLDMQADMLFTKLENVYDPDYVFVNASRFDEEFIYYLEDGYDASEAYMLYFKEYENPRFTDMEYCIVLSNMTDAGTEEILLNFPAWNPDKAGKYSITMQDGFNCGADPVRLGSPPPFTVLPRCDTMTHSIMLSKPVLYQKDIMMLKVLVCAREA
jgi:hypothetical protein